MSIFGKLLMYCPVCRSEMDGMRAFGSKQKCCSADCLEEFLWREALAIMNKPYYPREKR